MANTVVYWIALMCIAVAVRSEEINILFHMHDVVVGSNRTAGERSGKMANTVVYWIALMCIAVAVRSEEINILFHMHDVVVGSNRTAVPVGLGSILSPGFGAMVVIDDILTQQASPDSLLVGRAQGMYLSDSLSLVTRPDLLLVFTAIFEWPAEYRGSTLSIQGADRIFMDEREVSVVGGTGKFRFARGFATIHTVSTSLLANAVLLFNVTVRVP